MTRQSIEPTYDSQQTGPRYWVTSDLNDRVVCWRQATEDPFVRHTVRIGWWDLVRGLFRGRLTVTVLVGADTDLMNDVLELDANTLIPNSTRRAEFDAGMNQRLVRWSKAAEASSGDREPWS